MVLKKQTVWLLTMLTMMVVLSAYYLFYGDVKEIDMAQNQGEGQELANDEELIPTESDVEVETNESTSVEDYFTAQRMERAIAHDQLKDHYANIAASPDSSSEAIAEANAKIDEIETLESNELMVESMIKAEGYADAVVFTTDEKVKVIVQADSLENKEVVSIINLVSKQMNVPGINVSVQSVKGD